jgi:MscS family membrane protein
LFLKDAGRIAIYLVAILVFMGASLGLDVAAIVGGFGLGGLAIAFAAKETLENLIASIIIFVDKPFVVGDFVGIDGQKGTVEVVGLRSTRIRTLDRSLVSFPNRKMVDGALENVSERPNARVKFMLGLHNKSSLVGIQELLASVRKFIEDYPDTTNEHFVYINQIQDQGIYCQILYFVDSKEVKVLLQTQEDVNVFILTEMERLGIAFAELNTPTV